MHHSHQPSTQVSNLDSEQETPEMGSQTPDCEDPQVPVNDVTPDISNEEVVQVNETEVSSDQTPTSDKDDTSDPSLQGKSVKLPYVIYNLDTHKSIYIQKGTVVAYANKDQPEVDCFKISETYEEAQEVIQYRNHLPNHPTLLVPPKSDMICSPAEVQFHRRVELKDHNASAETKKRFEELCQQFPEVFSTNNEDIGRTNLITMDIDTGDSPPSVKKPYTLALKHYNWVQQEIELGASGYNHQKCLTMGQSYCHVFPRSLHLEKHQGGECA